MIDSKLHKNKQFAIYLFYVSGSKNFQKPLDISSEIFYTMFVSERHTDDKKEVSKMKAKKQIELAARSERRMRQDMHRPMVIPNKKKHAKKYACR